MSGGSLGSCSAGEKVEAYVWSGWTTTSQSDRYWSHGVFNLTVLNETSITDYGRLWGCAGTVNRSLKNVMLYGPFYFYCGDTIYLNLTATAYLNVDNMERTCDCPTYSTTDPNCPTCSLLDHPKCKRLGNVTVFFQPPGSISGSKWEDLNKNGAWDMGESPLSGWNISCNNTTSTFYNLTDSNGFYIFDNLANDTYTIVEELKPGWEQTYPTGGTPAGGHSVTVAGYTPIEDKNFGNFYNASYTLVKIAEHKLLPGYAEPGTQINYTIWINNTGKVNLTYEEVADSLEGSSYSLPSRTGDINSDNVLNASEKWRYDFNITVNETLGDICGGWINNTVITNFTTTFSGLPYIKKQAWANVSTNYTANFTINKIAECSTPAIPGTEVNYTIWINNTGNVNLTEVDVTDSLFNAYLAGNKTGDDYVLGVLNVSENWTYTFNFTIPANPEPWYNNTVTANFTDLCSNYVNKSAWANVSTTVCQTADAGNDTIACSGVAALLEGNATGFYEVEWNITAGCNETGLVWPYPEGSDPPLNATYTPSAGEDHCNLTFTVTGPCANVTDNVTVWVVDTPLADIRVVEPSRYAS